MHATTSHRSTRSAAVLALVLLAGCGDADNRTAAVTAQSCMKCHNGSLHDDYSGPGLENPHPFPGADNLSCTQCHGGDASGSDKDLSHVPPPPEIGDLAFRTTNARAFFNRLTLAGIDKYGDYTVAGRTWTALDYLQFVNPGDLRVVTRNRACGQCHAMHAECTAKSPLATEMGILSGASFAVGIDNQVAQNVGLYEETSSDLAFRTVSDPAFAHDPAVIGPVPTLVEQPVHSKFGVTAPDQMFNNNDYLAAALVDDVEADRRVRPGSPLANLFMEQVAFTCGDCHLGSAGANNRAGDFRSSGCTACHMPYSLGGRSGSQDPNINRTEPLDPDDIDAPERAHVKGHRIRSVARTLANGHPQLGIDDHTCAGCHQGSNRTVLQYWGIRLDQNQDLRNRRQYPANPVTFRNTAQDTKLFDPATGNRTFNGRNANQYIEFEDYDGDARDDTPADVHHEAGMGCIDCHGSTELHGGDVTATTSQPIQSRMEHGVAIRCEDCHGTATAYAPTTSGTTYGGVAAVLATDSKGRALKHVVRESDGSYWLQSRLDGQRHYVVQTRDVVVDTGRVHPVTGARLYNRIASYAMGRDDGNPATGLGPQQQGSPHAGFSHLDRMSCASCHSAWTNTCMGCHLVGEYDTGNNFSNITGERIVFKQRFADFVYQSPVPFQLGVGPDNEVVQVAANTKVFFSFLDRNDTLSQVFAFTDRRGRGNNPARPYPSLSHNAILAHSVRGRVTAAAEGPRYCTACHLTTNGLANHGAQYNTFRTALAARNYAALDFNLLQTHIGRNPGNQLDSPLWVHMVAGLGSGLFAFDQNGTPVNPLDTDPNRKGANGVAPATVFNARVGAIALDLDRIVEPDGTPNGSNNHALRNADNLLRDGAPDPTMAGPLGASLIQRLADPNNGIVLNNWFDADAAARGGVGVLVPGR